MVSPAAGDGRLPPVLGYGRRDGCGSSVKIQAFQICSRRLQAIFRAGFRARPLGNSVEHDRIIGGGQAGIPLARDLAGMGKRVALVERKDLGGSCINFGCTPTKAAIASARVAHLARRGAAFGLNIPTVDVDFLRVLQRARDISIEFRRGLDRRMDGIENPRLFRSHARFEGRGRDGFRVRLGAEVVIADEVVIDTGTRSLIPAIEGLAEVQFIHAGNWLAMARLRRVSP
jgi:pyruvate/2-oxoglutarate dehydrogenase complex dihydrolipoamide dehydrogenase (E3) component